jgi:Tfp pilus assembly protein FimT
MVVMGIIAMILGFAAPSIVGVLKGKKVEQAIGALSGILESARMDAITQNSYYWTGVAAVPKSKPTTSGQDELWVMTFRATKGENRVPTDSKSIIPTSVLQRIEGVGLVKKAELPSVVSGADMVSGGFTDSQNAARLAAQGGGGFTDSQNAARISLTVNGAIDAEGTARTIINVLNDSFYRGTGGAGALQAI